MARCTCRREAYWSEFLGTSGQKMMNCFGCHAVWPKEGGDQPSLRSGGTWSGLPEAGDSVRRLPWPISIGLAEQFGWYYTQAQRLVNAYPGLLPFVGTCEYLVLPVHDQHGEPVWFTARAMVKTAPRPYLQPPGVTPVHWRSWHFIPRKKKAFLAITEGIADAARLSERCDAVALCGMRYDGSLDHELRGRDVLVALDGDAPGYAASTVVGQQALAAGARSVRLVAYAGKDPTDWSDLEFADALKP